MKQLGWRLRIKSRMEVRFPCGQRKPTRDPSDVDFNVKSNKHGDPSPLLDSGLSQALTSSPAHKQKTAANRSSKRYIRKI
jgi:hypothetical protein